MSWEQLAAIADSNRRDREEWLRSEPEACPICGQPLDENSAGVLACPMGHWVWDGTPWNKA